MTLSMIYVRRWCLSAEWRDARLPDRISRAFRSASYISTWPLIDTSCMSLSIAEYADLLERRKLIWPRVPAPKPVKAKPSIAPLRGIKAVLWDVYGTLMRTPDSGFTFFPDQEVRLQVALDKTIHEFNMWNSMYRKPGPPWESMIHQFKDYAERLAMAAPKRAGDLTDTNLVVIWAQIIDRLFDKEYKYEESTYGDVPAFAEKVAYFFQCCVQATEARDGAAAAVTDLNANGIRQGILADGQSFTMVQLVNGLVGQGLSVPVPEVFRPNLTIYSHQLAVKKPSKSLYLYAVHQLHEIGIQPDEILHVSSRLETDLVPAKNVGMKTALLAAEKTGLEAPANLIKDPQSRPDRLLTDIKQITSVVEPV